MPEGHAIHRLADALDEAFGGRHVHVSSPQGRFADSAALLDGCRLERSWAVGKHLFVGFDVGQPASTVHIHLGLIGKLFVAPLAPPRGQVRMRINDDDLAADLYGPQVCELLSATEIERVVGSQGPDPLDPQADPELAWQRIRGSGKPIAALLMDQRIAAGVGNIYRAEVLFRHRVDPMTPGRQLHRATWQAIWRDLVALMPLGVIDGRIDSVRPEHTPEAMGRPPRVDRHGGEVYVYRRTGQPCLVCGRPVSTSVLEGRNLYWCSTCQRRHH